MYSSMTEKQAFAWAFCALCVPVMATCAARPWTEVLPACAFAALLYIIMYKLFSLPLGEAYAAAFGKAAAAALALTAIWTVLAAAGTLARSRDIYGDAPQARYCAAALIGLAAWTCLHERAGAKCAAVLAPVLAVGFGAFLFSALPQINPAWVTAPPKAEEGAEVFAVLLLPTALLFLPRAAFPSRKPLLLLLLAAPAAVSAICVGCLSIEAARQEPFAFFTLSQSLSLFSAVERFEPIVSALSFAAFYALTTLLLESAAALFCRILPQIQKKPAVILCAATAFALQPAAHRMPQMAFVLSGMLFWGFLPLGTLVLVAAKKDEKNMKKSVDKGFER